MSLLSGLITVRGDKARNAVVILDQTRLPGKEVYVELKTAEEIWEAIFTLKVRGAPAIGVAAAYGVAVCMSTVQTQDMDVFSEAFMQLKTYLATARPTAVNLFQALDRMADCMEEYRALTVEEVKHLLWEEAARIREEDAVACHRIGELGLSLLSPGMGILTHCNAGHLAVSEYGTALAPVYLGQERGYGFSVFADETRPLLQGARLTAFELKKAGVDVTLICDNMASAVMKAGKVQAILVGCDRVAANGDTANKIGTSGLAVLADYYHIPFYVLGPDSTIDRQCPDGNSVIIEERAPEEVTEKWYACRMAPREVKVYNPAFDVTDHALITAIITEKGIFRPPFRFG